MADKAYLERLSRELVDNGKLIEAGWVGLRIAAINDDAPALQLTEMRMAFFAGAQHLFGSIMSILDPGEEPTDADMDRITKIAEELETYVAELKAKIAQRRN